MTVSANERPPGHPRDRRRVRRFRPPSVPYDPPGEVPGQGATYRTRSPRPDPAWPRLLLTRTSGRLGGLPRCSAVDRKQKFSQTSYLRGEFHVRVRRPWDAECDETEGLEVPQTWIDAAYRLLARGADSKLVEDDTRARSPSCAPPAMHRYSIMEALALLAWRSRRRGAWVAALYRADESGRGAGGIVPPRPSWMPILIVGALISDGAMGLGPWLRST